jgi:hypothetical protein
MARPERHDVDYFPFIVKRGKTLNILQSKFGVEGIGVFTNIMRFLSSAPDHYCCIKDEIDRLNFFAEIGIEETKGIAMIELMVKTGKYDKELWEKHNVIACQMFLESIEGAYKNRRNKIITIEQIRAKFENGGVSDTSNSEKLPDNSHTTGFTDENEGNNPQKKKEETILKETKKDTGDSTEPPFSVSENPYKAIDGKVVNMTEPINLANLLLTAHRKEFPDFLSGKTENEIQKKIVGWADDIEKLIRIDKKAPEIIKRVILWVKTPNNFWFQNIESGKKLRDKFERLYGEMVTEQKKNTGPPKHGIANDNISDDKLDEFFS